MLKSGYILEDVFVGEVPAGLSERHSLLAKLLKPKHRKLPTVRALGGVCRPGSGGKHHRGYAADLEGFRHWCKKFSREWLPAGPETIGLYLGARADDLSLATLERHLAAIATLHKEEGYEPVASVAEGLLRKIRKGLVREKMRRQDGAPPLLVEDPKPIIEHLPRYSTGDEGPTGQMTLTSLCDRALLLIG